MIHTTDEINDLVNDCPIKEIKVDWRGDDFIVIIQFPDNFWRLGIALNIKKQGLSILQVNLIDDRPGGEDRNITSDIDNLLKNSPNKILTSIFQESLKIQKQFMSLR